VTSPHWRSRALRRGKGRKVVDLIHKVDGLRLFPDKLVLVAGLPARVHNISLIAGHQVSFKLFYKADDFNTRPREINFVEFTPDQVGEFTILHKIYGIQGTLVVETP